MKTTSYKNPIKVKQVLNIFDIFVMTTKSIQGTNLPVVGHGLPVAKGFKPQNNANGHRCLTHLRCFCFNHKEH